MNEMRASASDRESVHTLSYVQGNCKGCRRRFFSLNREILGIVGNPEAENL